MYLYAACYMAVKGNNARCTAMTCLANSLEEAIGITMLQAEKMLSKNDGWHQHTFSAMQVPDDFVIRACNELPNTGIHIYIPPENNS